MKSTFRAIIALLLTSILCTSCKAPEKKESSENKNEKIEETKEPEELEVEDEFDVDLEEHEAGAGF